MAWTAPKTWATGDLVTAALLNTHIRDNQLVVSTHTHSGAAGDGNDELTGIDSVVMDSISAPSAPSSSNQIILYDRLGRPYYRPNGGSETILLNSHGDNADTVGTRGDFVFRGASTWGRLGAGTSGAYLQTKGTGADPVWVAVSGSVVRKTADEAVTSSTTLQDDAHLKVALGASEVWAIHFHLFYTTANGLGVKLDTTSPSGATVKHAVIGSTLLPQITTDGTINTIETPVVMQSSDEGTHTTGGYASIGNYAQFVVLVVNSTNTGDLQLQWAPSGSSGTAVTMLTNSFLVAQKLA
jgi:hypothetical protein